MADCAQCGTTDSFIYTCPDCGDRYCDDHLDLEGHGCVAASEEPGVDDRVPTDDEFGKSDENSVAASTTEPADERSPETTQGYGATEASPGASESPETAGSDYEAEPSGGVFRRVPVLRRLFD